MLQELEDELLGPSDIHISQAMLCGARWAVAVALLRLRPHSELCRRSAMAACSRQGAYHVARRIFQRTRATQVLTFNAGITAYAKDGRWTEALQLLEEMTHMRLEPNGASLDLALTALSQAQILK